MTCTKTGVRVYLVDYDQTLPADLFEVGNCVIARFNMSLFDSADSYWGDVGSTHTASTGNSENSWWRKDLGVLVIPHELIRESNHDTNIGS